MTDYNEWLLNMYVIELAPVTGQPWFHALIAVFSTGFSIAGALSIISQFFGD